MSRRKQSNPKPLKYEENWNENEDGGKSATPKPEGAEKDAVDGCISSPRSSPCFKDTENKVEENETNTEESEDEAVSEKGVKHSRGSRNDRVMNLLVTSIKPEKGSTEDETGVKMSPSTSCSRKEKNHPLNLVDMQRKAETPDDIQSHSSPSSTSADLIRGRRESPGPSDSSNGPSDQNYSHDQLVQAGFPYLHLLPSSIRNDAARFFFMPPNVSPELTAAAVSSGPNTGESSHLQHKGKKTPLESPIPRIGPVYMCEPCNIKFSSSRTLEAHQTYYCSSRKELGEKEVVETKIEAGDGDSRHESRDTPSVGSVGGRKREKESSGEEHELSIDESQVRRAEGIGINTESSTNSTISNANKNIKTGKLYSCSYCSYSADKKVSLNRHMRMHSGGPPPGTNGNGNLNGEGGPGSSTSSGTPYPSGPGRNIPEGITAADRYCFDCEIQFTSLKTFKVHKQYYCSTRHVMKTGQIGSVGSSGLKVTGTDNIVKAGTSGAPSPLDTITPPCLKHTGAGSPVTPEGSPIPIGSPISPQPFVVLPTNPVIIVPYCFIQGASVVPGNLLPSSNALIILPNGVVQSLPGTTMPMPISMSFPSPPGQTLGGPLVMGPFGLPEISPASTTNQANLSPPGQHSVFNDPKDVIRRICRSTKNSSSPGEMLITSDSHPLLSQKHQRSSVSQKDGVDSSVETEGYERSGEESIPAIDLTLRNFIKKEAGEEEDEKENQDAGHRHLTGIQSHSFMLQGSCIVGGRPGGEIELRHEISAANSPSRQSHTSSGGSTHSGRRTPRPPSISSSCSSSPAPTYNSDHKHNGTRISRNPQSMNCRHYGESYPNGSRQMIKPKGDNHGVLVTKPRSGTEKPSPLTTQLPGGAILTTAGNQSLAELLMSNPSELTESLAKLNSHLMMNSGSPGLPPQFDSTAMMTAASLPADLAMSYLANIQQSIQHHHQLQAAKQHQQQATLKRGVWKCVDCEIVFYKQENFLVHKEQYCASRSIGNCSEGKGSNSGTKENNSQQQNQRGFKTKENQASKSEFILSRSSSSLGESSLSSPPLVPIKRLSSHLASSSAGELNALSIPSSRKSPKNTPSLNANEGKAHVEIESQFRIKSESPVSSLPSPVPVSSPSSRTTTPNHNVAEISTTTHSPSPTHYLCHKCGVKYSSFDNLTTHQTFYCNKRPSLPQVSLEEVDDSAPRSTTTISPTFPQRKSNPPISSGLDKVLVSGSDSGGFIRCGRCNLAIPDEQMALHKPVCLGQINGSTTLTSGNGPSSSSNTSGWKCPCCDTYSPTMSAAQKHLETHTGIRAFKCVICGYRGNTLRGMRTHIRMHFDKRSFTDLQEGDYISCITTTDLESSGQQQSSHSSLSTGVTVPVNGAINVLKKRRNRLTLVG